MVFLELLDMCIFCLLLEKDRQLLKDLRHGAVGKEKSESGWQKHFSIGQANLSAGVSNYAEAVKQQIIHTKW